MPKGDKSGRVDGSREVLLERVDGYLEHRNQERVVKNLGDPNSQSFESRSSET